jgi:hypothetical protein
MSYVGPPLVYGFNIIGSGCGLISPHDVVTLGRTTYWRGEKGLWQYGDTGVQPLPCSVYDYIFDDLDAKDKNKCHAAANSVGNEIVFYFPSVKNPFRDTSEIVDGVMQSNEPTRYIKLNTVEKAWDSGDMLKTSGKGRTAWINSNVFGTPLGADLNFRIQQHERGFNDDDQPMRGVYAETGYGDASEGTQIMVLDHCVPDFKWFGRNGGVDLSFKSTGYSGGKPVTIGPFAVTPSTQFFNPRVRGRYVALRFDWAPTKDFSARVGAPMFRAKPAGRRP